MQVDLYNTELTVPEAALGFRKVFVVHPRSEFYGNDALALAVIHELAAGDIIIKMNTPDGSVEYSHQRFGSYGEGGRPSWQPLLVSMHSAELAIRAARTGADQTGPLAQRVKPAPPEMTLHCPLCSHEFRINAYHVPFAASQRCPACNAEAEIGKFGGPQV